MTHPAPMPAASRQETRSRRIALSVLAAFAAIVLLVNGYMITTAVQTFTGVAVEGAYERGLAYNQTLEAVQAQAKLGWKGEIEFQQADPSAGKLSLRLQDADGQPISGAEVEVVLFRPAQDGHDFRAYLTGAGAGTYETDLTFPAAGVWDAYLAARARNASYQRRERLLVR
jgi:nitrogen fixation protein FixH